LLEDAEQILDWSDGGVSLDVTPFQIVTLKLTLAAQAAQPRL